MAGLPERWTILKPIEAQLAYRDSVHRFNTVPAGRRAGKSERAKRKIVKRALRGTRFSDPRFFAAAPTRDQAKRIYWNDLKLLVPREFVRSISETELAIRLITGAEIHVLGMDKPERIEGTPWDGGVLDEYANMKPGAWGENVRPALSDRRGWCDFIGVPEGRNHYYEIDREARAQMQELGPRSDWGAFHWTSREVLPPEEIAAAQRDLDPLTFAQEYEASFVNFVGRAYYCYTEETHGARLRQDYNPQAPLCIWLDFNISPGVAGISQEMVLPTGNNGTGIIGEVWIPNNSNTPAVCRKLIADWGKHEGRVMVYGDATGGAGGTAQTQGSDWEIARKMLTKHFRRRVHFRVPPSNPAERARVNAVNSRLKSDDGTIRMMVDLKAAPHVARDLEGVRTLEGGAGEIDKKKDPMLTHISDALGYYVNREFPVRGQRDRRMEVAVG